MPLPPEFAVLRKNVETLPRDVTLKLRAVAFRKSREVMAIAKAKVPVDSGYTSDNIHVIEQPERKQFLVSDGSDRPRVRFALHQRRSGRLHTQKVTVNMLPNWLEFGTRFMRARPFMRPAADAVEPSYVREMSEAAIGVVAKAIGVAS